MLTVIETAPLRGRRRFLPAYEGEELVAVAGSAPQADAFYGAELVNARRLSAGYLFKVRVVQYDVSRDLLATRLIPAPSPQTLKELLVYVSLGRSAGSTVGPLLRDGNTFSGGDALLSRYRSGRLSASGEGGRSVGLSEANVATRASASGGARDDT